MKKASDELLVIDKTYELIKWFSGHVSKFPKSHRYTLGSRVEMNLYDVLEGLIRARYQDRARRIGELDGTNLQLEILRFLGRLCHDLRFLSTGSYEYLVREIDEIGRMVGGWKRSLDKTG
jgi:hypothetical protein